MVSRITLLEPHFEGAQLGQSTIDSDTVDTLRGSSERESQPNENSSGKKSRTTILVQGLIGFLLLFGVLYVSMRAISSDESET